MASDQEPKAPAGRIALLGALLALEVSAAVAFGRVLQGARPTVQLAFAAGVSVLLAGALERRHVLLAAVISAAAFLVLVALVVFPDTTKLALPTLSTLRAMREAFAAVGRMADVQAAPALPLPPLMLAALTGVWAAAFSSHALAARARSPFLAVVPPAALLAFTNLVMTDGARPLYVLPFLASVLALLFADGMWRVGQWGPITMWRGRRSARLVATTTRGARRLALACLGVAVIAPGLLPGFRSPGLVDLQRRQGSPRISINPIVDLRAQLLRNPDIEVFTVRTLPSEQGAYWRITADDVFNGRQWSPSDADASGGLVLDGPTGLASANVQTTGAFSLTQHFRFDQFWQPELPAAFQPVGVDVPERIRYDNRSSVLFDANGTHPGFSYDVTSVEVNPSPDELSAVTSLDGPDLAQYTKLPANTPNEIYSIARRLTAGQPTIYAKILAIQNYLRTFRYSVNVPPGHSTNDILRFLTETKAGFCEQFAGTMAVLLRAIGIPSRVAVGFTSGTYDPVAKLWRVTSQDAHAWVEVLFPQFGWLAFEPTPGRANPVAKYTTPPLPAPSPSPSQANVVCLWHWIDGLPNQEKCAGQSAANQGGIVPATGPKRTIGAPGPAQRGENVGQVAGKSHRRTWILIGLLSLAVLLILAVPGTKAMRRRWTVAHAAGPRERVLAAYVVLAGRAADVGLGRRPAETLLEYRTRLKERMSLDGDMDRLAELTGRAAYGEFGISSEQADQAASSARRLARQIRKSAGAGKQIAGWFRVELRSRA